MEMNFVFYKWVLEYFVYIYLLIFIHISYMVYILEEGNRQLSKTMFVYVCVFVFV